jgi:hypothetical protein
VATYSAQLRLQPPLALRALLWVLLLGPPAAALFLATGVPLLRDTGWLARDLLSMYICPTPAKSYLLFGQPMAVCARCWGATVGLWIGYLWHTRLATQGQQILTGLLTIRRGVRLLLLALPCALWVVEIQVWPTAPLWAILLNGVQAGIAAGMVVCSVWVGRWTMDRGRLFLTKDE